MSISTTEYKTLSLGALAHSVRHCPEADRKRISKRNFYFRSLDRRAKFLPARRFLTPR